MTPATLVLVAALTQLPTPTFTPPQPGEEIHVSAGSQSQLAGGWVLLSDYVVIEYPGGRIQADSVQYNQETGDVVAEGNVVLESGQTVVTGSMLEFDLHEGVGIVHDAVGWTVQDVEFRGRTVEKIGVDKYRLTDGELTSCYQPLPIWRVKWSKAVIREDETAQMWNTVVQFKKMPAAYAPYVVFPIKDERSTGFLMPQISSSRRRGFSGSAAFFWAIARNQDALFELDWSEDEVAFAPTYRYIINDQARGEFSGRWTELNQDGSRRREQEARLYHDQRFGADWRWVADIDYTSSIDFTRQSSTNPSAATRQSIQSETWLQKSWGTRTFTARARDREWEERDEYKRLLPELELRQRSTQVRDWPMYWSYEVSLAGISQAADFLPASGGAPFRAEPSYERLNLSPELRFPFSNLSWLEVVPRLSLQETLYTAHLDPDEPEIVDDLLNRESGELALDIRGPKLERFYGLSRLPGKRKFHHLIEPEVSWQYVPDVTDAELAIRFDGIDSVRRTFDPRVPGRDIDLNVLNFGVVNRLFSKKIAEPGEEEGNSRELIFWSLRSSYQVNSFRDVNLAGREERTRFADINSTLRWRPSERASIDLINRYSVVADDLTSWSLRSSFQWGTTVQAPWPWTDKDPRTCPTRHCLNLRYNKSRQPTLLTTAESVDLEATFSSPAERYSFSVDLRHDLLNSEIQIQEYVFRYRNQCLGTRLSYFWNRHGEREVLFTLSLRHVGDFLDFRSRQGRYR